jgi:hypothetical protein
MSMTRAMLTTKDGESGPGKVPTTSPDSMKMQIMRFYADSPTISVNTLMGESSRIRKSCWIPLEVP